MWLIAGLAILLLGAGAMAVTALRNMRASPPGDVLPLRLALAPPEDLTLGAGTDYPFGLSLAPDGRRLVFPASKYGLIQLWVQDLTTSETQALPGTDDGVLPFWAPDGRAIGFFAGGRMRVITLENAGVKDLASAPSPRGGTWHPGGDIIFAPEADGPLYRRRGSDGAVEPYTTLDRASGESGHRHPVLIDAGHHVLFFVSASEAMRQGIWIAPLGEGSTRKRLIGSDGHGVGASDAVVYASDGALVAQRIDFGTGSLIARPFVLGAVVGRSPQHHLFATAGGDVLVYGAPRSGLRELRWLDRTGVPAGVIGDPMQAWEIRVSPDGTTVAVAGIDPQLGTLDIWSYEGDRPLPRRISPAIDRDETPVWARDGSRVAWVTGRRTVIVLGRLAELPDEMVRKFEYPVRVTDWSPDFQWIVISESRPDSHDDLWMVSPDGRSEPRPYAQSPFNEVQGVVSPDGRWMAYASDESGRFEIYIDSFPAPGNRARLTSGGGVDPRWKSDSGTVYFRRGAEIHAVHPNTSAVKPEAVASERLFDAGAEIRAYDVTPDGQRFLVNLPAAETERQPITVLVNWPAFLRTSHGSTETQKQ